MRACPRFGDQVCALGIPSHADFLSLHLPSLPHSFHMLEHRAQALGTKAHPNNLLLWVMVSAFAIPQQIFAHTYSCAYRCSRGWPSLPQLLYIQGLNRTKESEKCPFKHPELLLTLLIVPWGKLSPRAGYNEAQRSADLLPMYAGHWPLCTARPKKTP